MQKSIALCLSGKRQWFSNLVKDDEAVNPTGEEGADQDLNFRKAESLLFKEKETHAEGGQLLGGVVLKNIFEFEIRPDLVKSNLS